MIDMEKLDRVLLELGHPDNLSGTDYIRVAVSSYKPGMAITKELYPLVARLCMTTGSRVERSIRHSIERAWARNTYDAQEKYFGGTIDPEKGSPTNGEFIARLWRVCRAD